VSAEMHNAHVAAVPDDAVPMFGHQVERKGISALTFLTKRKERPGIVPVKWMPSSES